MTRRAAKIGFDWDNVEGIFEKIEEEKREILSAVGAAKNNSPARIEEEAGDLLLVPKCSPDRDVREQAPQLIPGA